jgi:hypothetical protein
MATQAGDEWSRALAIEATERQATARKRPGLVHFGRRNAGEVGGAFGRSLQVTRTFRPPVVVLLRGSVG